MKKILIILAVIILVGAGGAYAYYAYYAHLPMPQAVSVALPSENASSALPPAPKPPEGMYLYRSLILHFQIVYPDDLVKRVYNDGNTSTLAFEDAAGEHGFQVFVVPYGGDTVSQERFNLDVPTGVMQDPTPVVIDGVTATAFFSTNASLGDTREVWFIHGGLLYEINARKDLDEWLSHIMATWKFI